MVKGTDTHRLIVLIALVLGSCSGPAASPVRPSFHLQGDDPGLFTLVAGPYRVAWKAPGCTYLDLRWAPTSGTEVVIPITLPAGDVVVTLPAGSGYLNRAADCDYSIDVTPAG